MKKEKLTFLKPKKGDSIGQWLIEQGISAGFPSPADDFKEIRISLDKELVKNQESTFYARVSGESMENAGLSKLNPGKIIFVDSMFALARAAEQGVGIALLPLPVSQDWLNTGSLIPLHTNHLVTEDFYWILINGNSSRQRSALLFFQWMLDKFQKYR